MSSCCINWYFLQRFLLVLARYMFVTGPWLSKHANERNPMTSSSQCKQNSNTLPMTRKQQRRHKTTTRNSRKVFDADQTRPEVAESSLATDPYDTHSSYPHTTASELSQDQVMTSLLGARANLKRKLRNGRVRGNGMGGRMTEVVGGNATNAVQNHVQLPSINVLTSSAHERDDVIDGGENQSLGSSLSFSDNSYSDLDLQFAPRHDDVTFESGLKRERGSFRIALQRGMPRNGHDDVTTRQQVDSARDCYTNNSFCCCCQSTSHLQANHAHLRPTNPGTCMSSSCGRHGYQSTSGYPYSDWMLLASILDRVFFLVYFTINLVAASVIFTKALPP